jgi:hypothetical protein
MMNDRKASPNVLMQVRFSIRFALPIFFSGLVLSLIAFDFTFGHRFFLPEYGSEIPLFQIIFSGISLVGGLYLLIWGAWLLRMPPLLVMEPKGISIYNLWGAAPHFFPYETVQRAQVLRTYQNDNGKIKEQGLVLYFSPKASIPAHFPVCLGITYERYTLRIAPYLMQNKAVEVAAFLGALPNIGYEIIHKEV